MVFVVTAIMNFVVVAMALFILKPLRSRRLALGPQHAEVSAQ
jgi:large-conductance mechanosensitive channel